MHSSTDKAAKKGDATRDRSRDNTKGTDKYLVTYAYTNNNCLLCASNIIVSVAIPTRSPGGKLPGESSRGRSSGEITGRKSPGEFTCFGVCGNDICVDVMRNGHSIYALVRLSGYTIDILG